ncbi:hypothetical protein QOZ80_3BG0258120 [Eleusine coracana subsp. coracana]|nr:hypothetical protein QOZ80_3BG0258120 [Eleusine coracana subsp. coracana]
MAAVAPAAGHAADLLQKLSLEPKGKGGEVLDGKEKVSKALNGVSNGVVSSLDSPMFSAEQWGQQDYLDPSMYYGAYPASYYCGGWGDYSIYVSQDGADALSSGPYGDMYCYPQYGTGNDGQLYGSHQCQDQSSYHQPQTTASKPAYRAKTGKSAPSLQKDVSTVTAADQKPVLVDSSKTTLSSIHGVKGQKKEPLPVKPNGRWGNYQNQGGKGAYPWSGGRTSSERHWKLSGGSPTSTDSNRNNKGGQHSPAGTPSSGYMSSIYSSSGIYNANAYGPAFWYGSHFYGPGLYGGWNTLSNGKYQPRGKAYGSYGYGNENLDGLNELKRGPRSDLFKNQKDSGAAVATPAKGSELPVTDGSDVVVQDQYNHADFAETYSDARFFIIKSYSEDDIHKSIKYNVWASTPNGNKKLDSAYLEAKEKSSSSPIFLLFSVNTSGQFVGLAEMVGRVDFSKTVEYWQQDKWTGCFPVKWHIVKDIPNRLLKHIILEYNENKPVTNSRDTQEVKLEQGLQVLKIFKDHICKTSILDDFGFYNNREKIMQEKKSRCQQSVEKIMNRKVLTANCTNNEAVNEKQRLQKPDVVANGAVANAVVANGAVAIVANGVTLKDANLTTEGLAVANGC